MEILRNNRVVFAYIGYLSDRRIIRSRLLQVLGSLLVLIILIIYELTSAVYILQHLQIGDIENCLYAAIQAVLVVSAICSFLSIMYHNKERVRRVLDEFQKIVDQCKRVTNECVRNSSLIHSIHSCE